MGVLYGGSLEHGRRVWMGCASSRSRDVDRGLRRQASEGGVVRRVLRQEVRGEVRGGKSVG